MEFAEERGIRPGQGFDPPAQRFVGPATRRDFRKIQPGKQPAGVGVHHEHRPAEGIEQDAIGGLGPDAMQGEQPLTQRLGRDGLQSGRAARIQPPSAEYLNAMSLLAIAAGGTHRILSQRFVGCDQASRLQQPTLTQSVDGSRCILPAGVLHQDRAETDFERPAAGPPVAAVVDASQQADQSPQVRTIQPRESRFQRRRFRTRVGLALAFGRARGRG